MVDRHQRHGEADDLILTQHPNRITAGVVLDCVYPLARDHLVFPELLPEYEPHKVREVYLSHASQVVDFKTVEARVRERAASLGKAIGFAYAEGFERVVL